MIELQQLTKRYGDLCAPPSRKLAVDGISATIRPGVVTGFLGPNGAGKSTTMRMILGLDRPTSGAALVHGRPYVDSPAPLAEVGALLDAGPLTVAAAPATTCSPSVPRSASGRDAWTTCSHRSA
jgi:ABC-2 type transport system ATP-binding protein